MRDNLICDGRSTESCTQETHITDDHLAHYSGLLSLIVMDRVPGTDFCDLTDKMTNSLEHDLSLEESSDLEEDSLSDSESLWDDEECTDIVSGQLVSAGYTDCMEEAIRFLVEEEHISKQHPLLQNLREHLEKSRHVLLQSALSCDLQNNNSQSKSTKFSSADVWNTG